MHLVFDVSLTVARPWLAQPSGIDRVEFAHLRHWRNLPREDITFVMRNGWNQLAAIPDWLGDQYLDLVDKRVAGGMAANRTELRVRSGAIMYTQWWGVGRRLLKRRLAARPDSVFLTVSCATLHMLPIFQELHGRGCGIVPLIHDVIPLSHPQFMKPKETRLHRLRLQALSRYSDAGLVVSEAALADLHKFTSDVGLALPPMTVVHPGVDLRTDNLPPATNPETPYFLMVGSLEPRKNYQLIRKLWQELGTHEEVPRLVIVGRTSTMPHPDVEDMSSIGVRGKIEYRGRVSDTELSSLLKGARALLFPSVIEGFGIPVAEALAAGIPAIVSDIPAFREVGGETPEYVPPQDKDAWRRAILEYAGEESAFRRAQLARMPAWKMPTWDAHFQKVEQVLRQVASRNS